MNQRDTINRRTQMRFASLYQIIVPFFAVFVAAVLDMGRRVTEPPSWMGTARVVLVVVAVVYLVFPFFAQSILARSAERIRRKGGDPTLLAAMMCLSGSALPVTFALLLVFAGAPTKLVYTWAPISLVSALYWGWRYRHILSGKSESAAT